MIPSSNTLKYAKLAENIPLQMKQSSSTKFSRKELKLQNNIFIIYLKLLGRAFTCNIRNFIRLGYCSTALGVLAHVIQPITVILDTCYMTKEYTLYTVRRRLFWLRGWTKRSTVYSPGALISSLSPRRILMENHEKSAMEFQEEASREYCVESKTTFTLRYLQNRWKRFAMLN